jgi:hypothetical protein
MHTGTVTLAPLVATAAGFKHPSASTDLRTCWQSIGLQGTYDGDFTAVENGCGTPTGLVRYTDSQDGYFDQTHKEDTYEVKFLGGLCYGFFAVGDSTLADVDIRIHKLDGAVVSFDNTVQPVAIISEDDAWCVQDDTTYDVKLVLDGKGNGRYRFAIWVGQKK